MTFGGGKTAQCLRVQASVTGGMAPSLHTRTSYLYSSCLTIFIYKTENNTLKLHLRCDYEHMLKFPFKGKDFKKAKSTMPQSWWRYFVGD